ncbi:MAG TPA: hypothetical protein PK142_01180 [bacterium]|nr:hypothetical protein [bacterium]
MKNLKDKSIKYVQELFYFFSIAFVLFFLLEMIWPNFVLAYFNINFLLVAWILSVFYLLFNKNN